jgi:hypothetical protein
MTDRFFDEYSLKLGFDPRKDTIRASKLLDRAHEIRRFELDMYWRRAAYFWAFQAVSFGGVGLLIKDGAGPAHNFLFLALSIVGALTALVGYLTAIGSKFWQENWESHVDLLEEAVGERLTRIIITEGGRRFSVSKANKNLMLLFTVGWSVAIAGGLFPDAVGQIVTWSPWCKTLLVLLVLIPAVALIFFGGGSGVEGKSFQLGDADWAPSSKGLRRGRLAMIFRNIRGLGDSG